MKIKAIILGAMLAHISFTQAASSLYEIPLKDLSGDKTSLGAYRGKAILLVNVASQCGYTPQYKALQATYQKYKDKGLVVVGVPCNDFGSQEPGTNDEIKQFCSSKYSVTFPLMDKVHVKGPQQHPLFATLTGKGATFPGDIKWNFGKFLIGKDGQVLKRYDSAVTPDSKELTGAIEEALK